MAPTTTAQAPNIITSKVTSASTSTSAPTGESLLTRNALTILQKRYLEGETVDQLWDRVSGGNPRYRNLLSSLRFLPNSPTLFNAGRNNGCTLSACFVFDVEDSMLEGRNSICEVRNKAIAVAKAGGGVGYYGGKLRRKGAVIKSVQRVACGPVNVLRDYHAISRLITQGGKRELAQMFVLPCWHDDIQEFVHCKDEDPQALGSFNISVGWTKEGVERIQFDLMKDRLTLLQNPQHTKETALWWEQCESAWAHGCPGMFFPDTVNSWNYNLHLGVINAPNPCGETPNRTDEPCSLGSLVLGRYFDQSNRCINWKLLEEDVWTAIYFMDDILDRNVFPHPDITTAALLTRKLGLGVMGWSDLLAMLHIHYDTQEAVDLADKLMRFISEVASAASVQLAREKGPYTGYCSTRTQAPMRRNETVNSIAPTGTIAIIAGCKGFSIEPWFAELNERTTAEGIKLLESVPEWVKERLDGFVPKTTEEVGIEWHVKHQAAFQKNTDLGVSKTINLPNSATVEDVSKAYKLMYDLGCKGGTIYRDGSRDEQVLVRKEQGKQKTKSVYLVNRSESGGSSNSIADNGTAGNSGDNGHGQHQQLSALASRISPTPTTPTTPAPQRRKLGDCTTLRHRFRVAGANIYLHVGLYEDGQPGEIFLRGSMWGSTVAGMLDSWAMAISMCLQHGVPLERLVSLHRGHRFEPNGPTGNNDLPTCTSIQDYVMRWLEHKFGKGTSPASTPSIPSIPSIPSTHSTHSTHSASASTAASASALAPLASTPKSTKATVRLPRSGIQCPDCGTETVYCGGCLYCPAEGCGYSRCS